MHLNMITTLYKSQSRPCVPTLNLPYTNSKSTRYKLSNLKSPGLGSYLGPATHACIYTYASILIVNSIMVVTMMLVNCLAPSMKARPPHPTAIPPLLRSSLQVPRCSSWLHRGECGSASGAGLACLAWRRLRGERTTVAIESTVAAISNSHSNRNCNTNAKTRDLEMLWSSQRQSIFRLVGHIMAPTQVLLTGFMCFGLSRNIDRISFQISIQFLSHTCPTPQCSKRAIPPPAWAPQ